LIKLVVSLVSNLIFAVLPHKLLRILVWCIGWQPDKMDVLEWIAGPKLTSYDPASMKPSIVPDDNNLLVSICLSQSGKHSLTEIIDLPPFLN
jgi:hypothetical protein